MIGLEVIYKNGTKDWYDPIQEEDIFEYQDYIKIIGSNNFKYILLKESIERIVPYELCEKCNYSLEKDHICKGELK